MGIDYFYTKPMQIIHPYPMNYARIRETIYANACIELFNIKLKYQNEQIKPKQKTINSTIIFLFVKSIIEFIHFKQSIDSSEREIGWAVRWRTLGAGWIFFFKIYRVSQNFVRSKRVSIKYAVFQWSSDLWSGFSNDPRLGDLSQTPNRTKLII